MRRFILTLFWLFMASAASGQNAALKQLNTGDEGRGWEAVGRIDFGKTGFCTGVLVDNDLVLTAAHCLFERETGKRFEDTTIRFQAGLRNGRASAHRAVKYSIVHPKYTYSRNTDAQRVRNDVALLQLTRPIRNTEVTPFETDTRPAPGAPISVVSYAHDRADAPSLQESCKVKSRQRGVLVMSCSADFGASGAPVFSLESGVPKIVSLISAKAESDGEAVSLGTSLEEPLALLKVELKAKSMFKSVGNNKRPQGAKFLRP